MDWRTMLMIKDAVSETPECQIDVALSGGRNNGVLRLRDMRPDSVKYGEWQTFSSVDAVRAAFPELRIPQED